MPINSPLKCSSMIKCPNTNSYSIKCFSSSVIHNKNKNLSSSFPYTNVNSLNRRKPSCAESLQEYSNFSSPLTKKYKNTHISKNKHLPTTDSSNPNFFASSSKSTKAHPVHPTFPNCAACSFRTFRRSSRTSAKNCQKS